MATNNFEWFMVLLFQPVGFQGKSSRIIDDCDHHARLCLAKHNPFKQCAWAERSSRGRYIVWGGSLPLRSKATYPDHLPRPYLHRADSRSSNLPQAKQGHIVHSPNVLKFRHFQLFDYREMPGRKRADRTAPIHRRARTGCKSCRARKIKCDEGKPACRNCSSRGLACDNGLQLKWHEEFETRGIAFGRQGVWTKDQARGSSPRSPSRIVSTPSKWLSLPEIGPHHFLHMPFSDFESDGGEPVVLDPDTENGDWTAVSAPFQRHLPPLTSDQSGTLPQSIPYLRSLEFDSSLLEYYIKKLCPLTTSSRTSLSPFADLIQPLFTTSGQDEVLQSLMAFSARHRSIADPRWNHKAMSLKGSVLSSLQRRLATSDTASLCAVFPQVLITMMFLCLYEIVDKCDHRWVIHLRASQDIIRRSRALGFAQVQNPAGGLAAFAERFFAFQDAISRTACGDAPLFGVEYWNSLTDKRRVDSWMGCSPELAGVLCDITELGRAKAGAAIPTSEFFERADILERRIHSLASATETCNDEVLASSAELKRLSASLYLHCVLYDANPTTPVVSHLVQHILGRILRMLRAGHARALAFPVFVAAVELNPMDDVLVYDHSMDESIYGRRLVLETLDAMSTDSLSNVTRTRAVIQKVWRLRDMHLEEESALHKPKATKIEHGNDWTTFVGPNSSYISLA